MAKKARIKKGDTVVVVAGRDKGRQGEVMRVIPEKDICYVKGINMVKKTVKKSKENPNGSIMDIEAPIHISNVMLYSSKAGKGVRVGYTIEKDGTKKRVARGSVEQTFD